jgi:hypothetical protein
VQRAVGTRLAEGREAGDRLGVVEPDVVSTCLLAHLSLSALVIDAQTGN